MLRATTKERRHGRLFREGRAPSRPPCPAVCFRGMRHACGYAAKWTSALSWQVDFLFSHAEPLRRGEREGQRPRCPNREGRACLSSVALHRMDRDCNTEHSLPIPSLFTNHKCSPMPTVSQITMHFNLYCDNCANCEQSEKLPSFTFPDGVWVAG